jgi:hypothetical protein
MTQYSYEERTIENVFRQVYPGGTNPITIKQEEPCQKNKWPEFHRKWYLGFESFNFHYIIHTSDSLSKGIVQYLTLTITAVVALFLSRELAEMKDAWEMISALFWIFRCRMGP